MKEEWIWKAPSLQELIQEERDERKGRHSLAVIIPVCNANDWIEKQFTQLSKQTYQDFDIIIVHGEKDEFVRVPKKLNVLQIREIGKNGAGGGYFVGEKKAMLDKYKYICMTDADCLPESSDLLENLVKKIDEDYDIALPHVRYKDSNANKGFLSNHYGCVHRNVYDRIGFTYIPYFFGGEEFDRMYRMARKDMKMGWVDSIATHPTFPPVFLIDDNKEYYYTRGFTIHEFLNRDIGSLWTAIFLRLIEGLLFAACGHFAKAKTRFSAVWAASEFRFFSERLPPPPPAPFIVEKGKELVVERRSTRQVHENLDTLKFNPIRFVKHLVRSLADLQQYFGKKIILQNSEKRQAMGDLLIALMSKRLLIEFQGKTYRLIDNRGTVSIILGILFTAFLLPALITVSFLLLLRGLFIKNSKKISSENYGL
ncbi:glycosyltransferase [Candidatus Micrarchaeota archaeon]|nr:glycosyltransferase [Candidatus Micrarchaeota archaeon]